MSTGPFLRTSIPGIEPYRRRGRRRRIRARAALVGRATFRAAVTVAAHPWIVGVGGGLLTTVILAAIET